MIAGMKNFDQAVEATNSAINSGDSAINEYNVALQGIDKKIEALKGQFLELVWGRGGLSDLLKVIIDSGTAILKFANSDIGQAIIKVTAFTATFGLLGKAIGLISVQTIPTLISNIAGLANVFSLAKTGAIGLNGALKMLGLNPTVLVITAMVAGTYALVKAFDYFNVTLDESVSKLNELRQSSDNSENELKTLKEQLENVRAEIEKINSSELEITNSEQTEELHEQEKSLERQVYLAEQKARIDRQALEEQARKTLTTKDTSNYVATDSYEMVSGVGGVTASEELKLSIAEYEKTRDEIARLEQEDNVGNLSQIQELEGYLASIISRGNEMSTAILTATSSLDGLNNITSEADTKEQGLINTNNSLIDTWNNLTIKTEETTEATSENSENQVEYSESAEVSDDVLKEFAKDLGISKNELVENAEGLGLGIDAYYEYASAMKDVNENVDNIQEAYGTLQTAVEEYNSANGFTIDTIQALLSLDPEYLTMLELENGQLVLNEEAIRNKMIAQAEEAKQIIYNTAIEKLNAIASEESGDASTTSSEKRKDAVAGIDEETNAINRNTMANVANKASNVVAKDGSKAKDVQKILDETKAQIDVIDEAVKNMGTNFEGSMGKAKSSTRGANSALRQQDSIVKSLKSQYKSAFDKIIASIDLQIKAIKKAKEEALKSIDAQIKALEKEKAQREKYWDDRINALKKENTERERNISLQEKEQQLALAKQTQVMLYTGEGETGFEYAQDEGAVSKAEQELFDEQQAISYERQLEQLEELKEAEMESYDERIEALQEYREKVEEEYDQQIEALEELKERAQAEYDQQVEALENFKEQSNVVWEEIVANLNESVAKYNAGLSKIKMPVIGAGGKVSFKSSGDNYVDAYASGVASIDDTSLAVVGDSPSTREIVIGSKLNTDGGVLTALRRGSGVVNHKATETVAGMLNGLNGQLNNGSTNGVLNDISNSNSNVTNLNIQSVNVEANDANDFVESMKQFSATIKQDSYSR